LAVGRLNVASTGVTRFDKKLPLMDGMAVHPEIRPIRLPGGFLPRCLLGSLERATSSRYAGLVKAPASGLWPILPMGRIAFSAAERKCSRWSRVKVG
jgi:hypothetical protein